MERPCKIRRRKQSCHFAWSTRKFGLSRGSIPCIPTMRSGAETARAFIARQVRNPHEWIYSLNNDVISKQPKAVEKATAWVRIPPFGRKLFIGGWSWNDMFLEITWINCKCCILHFVYRTSLRRLSAIWQPELDGNPASLIAGVLWNFDTTTCAFCTIKGLKGLKFLAKR